MGSKRINPPTLEQKFWMRVKKSGGCWEWTGYRERHGYGRITIEHGKPPLKATWLSWQFNKGPVPPGMWVLHRCDNPPCVNPDHLYLGTHADNMRDMVARGRHAPMQHKNPPGENNSGAKLRQCEAEEIVRLNRLGIKSNLLAKMFPVVSARHIRKICSGRKWAQVIAP